MQKFLSGGGKEWLLIAVGAMILLASLLIPLKLAFADLTAEEERLMLAYEKDELIRIHVIANSNSPEDQNIKLKVRDALIDAFGNLMSTSSMESSDAIYQLLQNSVGEMQKIAQKSAAQNGFHGSVYAEVGKLALPEKQYGSVCLPKGEYRALRIVIGEGLGENWWCILYPQLCLALADADKHPPSEALFQNSRSIFRHWLLLFQ